MQIWTFGVYLRFLTVCWSCAIWCKNYRLGLGVAIFDILLDFLWLSITQSEPVFHSFSAFLCRLRSVSAGVSAPLMHSRWISCTRASVVVAVAAVVEVAVRILKRASSKNDLVYSLFFKSVRIRPKLACRLFLCETMPLKVTLHWSTCNANLQRRFATHVFCTNLQTCYTFESLSKTSNALQHCKYRKKSFATAVTIEWFFAQHHIIASWRCKLTSVTSPLVF